MEDYRLTKIALFDEVSTGYREREIPKKLYNDCLKTYLAAWHVDHLCWSDVAADRIAWRHSTFKAVIEFEADRRDVQ